MAVITKRGVPYRRSLEVKNTRAHTLLLVHDGVAEKLQKINTKDSLTHARCGLNNQGLGRQQPA